jgi:hypothetical protein
MEVGAILNSPARQRTQAEKLGWIQLVFICEPGIARSSLSAIVSFVGTRSIARFRARSTAALPAARAFAVNRAPWLKDMNNAQAFHLMSSFAHLRAAEQCQAVFRSSSSSLTRCIISISDA